MIIDGGNYTVYVHINKENNKVYVGTTLQKPLSKRWGACGVGYKRNKPFYADILKYGWDKFEHEIVASGLNENEASNMEKILIQKLDSTNPEHGYNVELGGLNKNEVDRRRKISESTKGANHHSFGKTIPEDTRKKIGDAMRGEKGYWYGKKLPQETLDKMSAALKGKPCTIEFKEINEKRKRSVKCVETGVTYESITLAERETGINHASITRTAHKKQATAGGLHWIFI